MAAVPAAAKQHTLHCPLHIAKPRAAIIFIDQFSTTLSTLHCPHCPLLMFIKRRKLVPLADRGPLRIMFVLTSMPIGGAETLLVELVRRLDRDRFTPELCCLKRLDPLGEVLAAEIPAFTGLLRNKFDFGVLRRLARLLRQRRIDAVVTIGPGDKMFWGRLSAYLAGVPVICSALHSTGYPDHVEWLNRRLASVTDAFIAVAKSHGKHLAEREGCPAGKVRVIPNGVDVDRFHPRWPDRAILEELKIEPRTPTVGILAALRPEKNHELFLRAAAIVRDGIPNARFLIIGDGPERPRLEWLADNLGLAKAVRFLGSRRDVPDLLSVIDVLALTSLMEANPVSILEAMAAEKPVVATRVGSVPESVIEGKTGLLATPGSAGEIAACIEDLLKHPEQAALMGRAGREEVILRHSIDGMVEGYQDLLSGIYDSKAAKPGGAVRIKKPLHADRLPL
jgi:glycosyltransferase involved in cell wall biosynthesis